MNIHLDFGSFSRTPVLAVLAALLSCTTGVPAAAEIRFENFTASAGLDFAEPTAGVAWGDLDGDSWPDLWLTGHHGNPPRVFRNDGGSTLRDVSSTAIGTWSPSDLHGAAWADFDGDGDADLLALSGGGAGRGSSPNQLFENRDGVLHERAAALGIDYPLGRGRTPLWLDVNGDRRLDALLVNYPRPGGAAGAEIFLQRANGGFAPGGERTGYAHGRKSRVDRWVDLAWNAWAGRYEWPGTIGGADFAQLADLTGDGRLELLSFSRVFRVFSLSELPLTEITTNFAWPSVDRVRDAAIGDFDGDGRADLYLVRSRDPVSTLSQTAPTEIEALLVKGPAAQRVRGLSFDAAAPVDFVLQPPWRDPTDPRPPPVVWVAGKRHEGELSFTVTPEDATSSAPVEVLEGEQARVHRDPKTGRWTLRSSFARLTVRIRSSEPIRAVEALGFQDSDGADTDALLFRRGDGFVRSDPSDLPRSPCHSVGSGDFDNDADLDLYLVCSGPLHNLPNLLLENDGHGRFEAVPDAGGADGTDLGRGDVAAVADFDRDGCLDLLVANGKGPPPFADGPAELFRNRCADEGNHWLEIELVGKGSNRDAIGASVWVEAAGRRQHRDQGGGMHSFAQDDSMLHFGLGEADSVENLEIRWPDGEIQRMQDVAADQILTVLQPE